MFDGDQLVTDSRVLARTFNRAHKDVLRAYDNLKCSADFSRLNFEARDYVDERGKPQRSVTMTKDGFTMLAMGFTGPSAMAFKEVYIAAFNAMAEHIASHQQNLWQMYHALMATESESKVRASFGSHLMIKRKREIPYLDQERAALAAQIQPSLFVNCERRHPAPRRLHRCHARHGRTASQGR